MRKNKKEKEMVYLFPKCSLYLKVGRTNKLISFKGSAGYWRLQQSFGSKSLRKAIKISNPKATFKELANTGSLRNAPIDLNDFIGEDVFKSGLMSRLKTVAGSYIKK